MKYFYPALFIESEGKILIRFPDFPHIHTEGDSLSDAFDMAEDALGLWLWTAEENAASIPKASKLEAVSIPAGSYMAIIAADTMDYRRKNDKRSVKKTLTIPRWLDTLAQKNNVNFSRVLQDALKAKLLVKN